MTPNTLPPWETSSAIVGSVPLQPVAVASAWPCVSWPSTNVTCDAGAVDRAVLGVGDRDRERDGVAEREQAALDRHGDVDRRARCCRP